MRGKVAKAIRRALKDSEVDIYGRRYIHKPAGIRVADAPVFGADGRPNLPVVTVFTVSLNPESGRGQYHAFKRELQNTRRRGGPNA